eukprot:TRINITY_DN7040_c0_g1_i1.p1 TRINITY_DN7040_c0_g1~~TRINITY_DN7040_c0_g1_i1.p1  ORF type:complete len:365 (-),score=112.74 TRINITY_DN7040_c0_g1_i1:137-1231(-)
MSLGRNVPVSEVNGSEEMVFWVRVSIAPTGKAKCVSCKRAIGQGSIRLKFGTGYHHIRCVTKPLNQFMTVMNLTVEGELSEEKLAQLQKWKDQMETIFIARKSSLKQFESDSVSAAIELDIVPSRVPVDGGIGKITADDQVNILAFFDAKDLCRLERVCKSWYKLASDYVWKILCSRIVEKEKDNVEEFKHVITALRNSQRLDWRQTYSTMRKKMCDGCGKVTNQNPVTALGIRICGKCAGMADYKFKAKKYLKEFGLVEDDIKKYHLRAVETPNPWGGGFAPMKAFLVKHLKAASARKSADKEEVEQQKNKQKSKSSSSGKKRKEGHGAEDFEDNEQSSEEEEEHARTKKRSKVPASKRARRK